MYVKLKIGNMVCSPRSFFSAEDNWFGFVALSNDKKEVSGCPCWGYMIVCGGVDYSVVGLATKESFVYKCALQRDNKSLEKMITVALET